MLPSVFGLAVASVTDSEKVLQYVLELDAGPPLRASVEAFKKGRGG